MLILIVSVVALFAAAVLTVDAYAARVIAEWFPYFVIITIFGGIPGLRQLPWSREAQWAAAKYFARTVPRALLVLSPILWFSEPEYRPALGLIWCLTTAGVGAAKLFYNLSWPGLIAWLTLAFASYGFTFAVLFPDEARSWTQPYILPVLFGSVVIITFLFRPRDPVLAQTKMKEGI